MSPFLNLLTQKLLLFRNHCQRPMTFTKWLLVCVFRYRPVASTPSSSYGRKCPGFNLASIVFIDQCTLDTRSFQHSENPVSNREIPFLVSLSSSFPASLSSFFPSFSCFFLFLNLHCQLRVPGVSIERSDSSYCFSNHNIIKIS